MAQEAVKRFMICIGGSAGSLEVIFKIVPALPVHSGASFVIVVHRRNDNDSILADLLRKRTKMKVAEVEDKERILPDHIYIAPSDYHLLFENEQTFSLDSSEKIHHSRPSIDVTFESLAEVFGSNAIGVLLSGANADGAVGLKVIRECGGKALVQNPETAEVNFMPQQAVINHYYDEIVNPDNIGKKLSELIQFHAKKLRSKDAKDI